MLATRDVRGLGSLALEPLVEPWVVGAQRVEERVRHGHRADQGVGEIAHRARQNPSGPVIAQVFCNFVFGEKREEERKQREKTRRKEAFITL